MTKKGFNKTGDASHLKELPNAWEVYELGSPESFGKIPVRTDLTILEHTPGGEPIKGWFIKEIIGVGIANEWVFLPWYKKLRKNPRKLCRELYESFRWKFFPYKDEERESFPLREKNND